MIEEKNEIERTELDPSYVRLLGVIGLTPRESKALLTMVTYRTTNPTDVAQLSGIPKSKIYETVGSLVEQGYLVYDGRNYDLSPRTLSMLKDNVQHAVQSYLQFLSRVSELHPNVSARLASQIEKLFHSLNFDVVSKGPLKVPPEYLERLPRSRLPMSLIGSIVSINAISSTSGHRVTVLIFSSLPPLRELELADSIGYLSYVFGRIFEFDYDTLVVLADQALRKHIRNFEARTRGNVRFFSLSSDYVQQVQQELLQFDRQWQQKRERILRLEAEVEVPYREITRLSTFFSELRGLFKDKETAKDRWLFQALNEILDRMNADWHAISELHMDLRYNYKQLANNLRDRRRLPSEDQMAGIQNSTQNLMNELQRLSREASTLFEELVYLHREDSRYREKGYAVNPFVFTIPVEGHLDLVNQEKAVAQVSEFIRLLVSGEYTRNILFLVDEPGMGKTHMMKYFLEELNSGGFGPALGLYLRCLPGSDLIALFNQLAIAIESQVRDKGLKEVLKTSLIQNVAPMTVSDFVDLLRRLSQLAYDRGVRTFLLFIDEFENTRSTSHESTTAFLQLRSLLETAHVGYLVAMRKDFWESNAKELDRIFASLRPYVKFDLDRFTADTVKKLLKKRLDMFREGRETVIFSDGAAAQIALVAKGNPREVIRYARDAFRRSIVSGKSAIEVDTIKELSAPILVSAGP